MSFASHLRKDVGRTLRDRKGMALALLLPAGVLAIYSSLDLDAFAAAGRDPDAFILVISTSLPALLAASTALVEERRLGTFGRLARSPARAVSVVAAKLGAGLLVSVLQGLVLLALAAFLLGKNASHVGPGFLPLLLLLVLNGLAAYALGLFISSIVSTEAQATQLTSLALLVMITLAGFLQPLHQIGGAVGIVAAPLPMALGYATVKGFFDGEGLLPETAFFVVDALVLVALAGLIARWRASAAREA